VDRLNAMETFVRVVETGSFSAAARTLNLGQPAVSKTIAQMEARLGVRLLMRSTRGLSPTEAGQSFYDHARRVIDEADEAELVARGAGVGLTGRLRVCAAVTFARLHVIPRLPKFLAAHPDLTMDVVLDDRCRAAANDEKSAHSRILLPHEMRIFCRTFLNIAAKYATTHRRCAAARREDRT